MTALGLTWDHPRGYNALAQAARQVNAGRAEPLIDWVKQPLEGFESGPITDLTARHDLVVLDHPHIGEAVAEDCLIPLQDLYPPELLQRWEAQSIGPAFRSYEWEGRNWAVPLDVATQVMALRPDLLPCPTGWDEIAEISATRPVALSLGGPHAFLNLISMAAAEGVIVSGDALLPDATALPLLSRLRALADHAPKGSTALNPIDLLERMGRSDDIALVPLIFGYVTYARPGHVPNAVAFSDTIRAQNGRGGVLGGTGIAFSRRARPGQDLLDHIAWLMEPETQARFIPANDGQPSARAAWQDADVNAAWADFYRTTEATAEAALLRPRYDGFPAFTLKAAARMREGFAARHDETQILNDLRRLWRDSRLAARGDLDDNRG